MGQDFHNMLITKTLSAQCLHIGIAELRIWSK